VLATSVSRTSWALSHLAFALAGTAFLLVVAGLTAGLSYAAATDFDQFGRVFGAALAQLPAAMVLTGIAFAAFGLVPQYSVIGWAALAGFVAIGLVGPILGLDQWVIDISPFSHTPKLPGTEFTAAPLVWLVLAAGTAIAVGFAGLRRRDIA
jgi:ABC-2 type transport system permease protein